jgi:hypothetical protein
VKSSPIAPFRGLLKTISSISGESDDIRDSRRFGFSPNSALGEVLDRINKIYRMGYQE